MQFTKRFSGSYFAVLPSGDEVKIQTMSQYTWDTDIDSEGNKWVMTFDNDWHGDKTTKAKTKKELVDILISNWDYFTR